MKPGYKLTEAGVIPNDWLAARLGDALTLERGFDLPARLRREGAIPVVSSSGATSTHSEHAATSPGIVTGRYGTIGKVFFIEEDYWPLNTTLFSRSFHGNDPKFLTYLLRTVDFQTHSGKSGVPGVNRNDIHELIAAIPPVEQQRAIAKVLSDVDALLSALDRLIAKKRDLKQAAMQQLLTGKTRLPGFDGEWELKTLSEICEFRGGKAHEPYIDKFGDFICVNSKFISTNGEVRKFATKNLCCARKGDVLMVMSDLPNGRALAKAFLVDQENLYAVNQRVCALSASESCPTFLFYVLDRNPYFLKFDDGVSQTHLLNDVFKKCELALPPSVDEQVAIAAILSSIDDEIIVIESRRQKTHHLKQGMMQDLLTGKTRLISPENTDG